MNLVYVIGAFLAGMVVAWDFVARPSWLPKLGSGSTSTYSTSASSIGWTEIVAGIAALAAILQSSLFKDATGVIGKLRDFVVTISKFLALAGYKTATTIFAKASTMIKKK
jgi:hypothetical protein